MLLKDKNIEFIVEEQEPKPKSRKRIGIWRDFVDGTVLTKQAVVKQLPFILFLAFIALTYIGNRYHAERVIKEIKQSQRSLKELRSESISISSELNRNSMQSAVYKKIEEKGLELEESVEPPKVLKVKKK